LTDFRERDEEARDFQGRHANQGGLGGAGMKVTVRNLRIREDTPKYLRNLDLNSNIYIYIYKNLHFFFDKIILNI